MVTVGDAFDGSKLPGEEFVSDFIGQAKNFFIYNGYEWVATVIQLIMVLIGIVFFFAFFFGCMFVLAKTILPPYLSSYCYVNFSLRTKINGEESDKVGFLFNGYLNGMWYPLRSLRKLNPEFRREALFAIANDIAAKHGLYPPFPPKPKQGERSKHQQYRQEEKAGAGASEGSRAQFAPQTVEYLAILGFENMPVNQELLRSAYLLRLKEFHPDKFGTERPEIRRIMEEKTKQINLAYEYLSQQLKNGAD